MKKIYRAISVTLILVMLLVPVSVTAQAATASQIKSKVISIAENEVGYEGTSTYSKYGEWYGYQGGWCTTFVLWCFNKAGNALDVKLYGAIVPNGGNCNSMISWFKNKDQYHKNSSSYTAKVGDLVFFDWSGNGSAQHVGIVTSVSGSSVYTVEGNCSGKVKDRVYTTSGSKPYNNVSSIMGYATPDWNSVANSSSSKTTTKKSTTKKQTTTKKHTTTKKTTTTKKQTTTKKVTTTKKQTTTKSNKTTSKTTTTQKATEKETTIAETTTQSSTSSALTATNMTLYAASTELEVGDSVKLDYTVEPSGSNAVVGYFCDEENVIEISNGGKITAIGEGTATVVVCANDEIYRQCDFTVTAVSSSVTRQSAKQSVNVVTTTQSVSLAKTNEQKLNEIGINIEQLKSQKDYYVIPAAIAGATALLSLAILIIKKISKSKRQK
jgi:hypothetical protein